MKRFFVLLAAVSLGCNPSTEDAAGDGGSTLRDVASVDDASTPDASVLPDGSTAPDTEAADLGAADTSALLDSGAQDVGPTPVAAFVAQGHMGRTTVSCDDGRSWRADSSLDDAARCFTGALDCDHHAGAGRGVEWGDGAFLTTFGWGEPGGIDRSVDGVTWERVLADTTFGGIVYGNGRWLAAARNARWSDDGGATWTAVTDTAMTGYNVRRAAFVPAGAGLFVMVADGETVISTDAENWTTPTLLPVNCGAGIQTDGGLAYGNGVISLVGASGNACSSTDDGDTWKESSVGGDVTSHLLFDGEAFVVWGRGMKYSSNDGDVWTSTATTPANLLLGPTAHDPTTGTYVGVRGGWQTWYEDQEFYRSSDGIDWQTLDATAFTGSHPIRDISLGWVNQADCP